MRPKRRDRGQPLRNAYHVLYGRSTHCGLHGQPPVNAKLKFIVYAIVAVEGDYTQAVVGSS